MASAADRRYSGYAVGTYPGCPATLIIIQAILANKLLSSMAKRPSFEVVSHMLRVQHRLAPTQLSSHQSNRTVWAHNMFVEKPTVMSVVLATLGIVIEEDWYK